MDNYEYFLKHGTHTVHRNDLTPDEKDKCFSCLEDFGLPNADGEIEPLVRLAACRHIMGRDCLGEWIKEHRNNTCPVCRRELFDRYAQREPFVGNEQFVGDEQFDDDEFDPVAPPVFFNGLLRLVPLSAEASAALRARNVDVDFDLRRTYGELNLVLFGLLTWPAELGLTVADLQGSGQAVDGVTEWLIAHEGETYGVADLEQRLLLEAAVSENNEAVGPQTRRCTQLFIQTLLACHLEAVGFNEIAQLEPAVAI